jgi:hypothetical protein
MPTDPVAILAASALGVAALALAVAVLLLLRVRRVGRVGAGASDAAGLSLEATVAAELERLATLEARVAALDERARGAVQRVGVVRYNPFEDTGSNQSFALALLDDRGDGVVISSLHSRQSTRIYLKPISGGRSDTALSDEESEALRKAGRAAQPR